MTATPVAELRQMLADSAKPVTTSIHAAFDIRVPSEPEGVRVRVYEPSVDCGRPVVMWMHSGGFVVGGLDQNEEYLRALSVAAGVDIVSVDYRLAPEHRYPAALADSCAVWEWIKSGPPELRGDTALAAVAGESAGGALALALSQRMKDLGGPMPLAQIVFYGTAEARVSNPELSTSLLTPTDCQWFWDQYAPGTAARRDPGVSPAVAENLSGLPATLLITAEVDVTRDATEDYARRLVESGVPVEQTRYAGVMHGFATMTGRLPQADQLFSETVDFIRRRVLVS
ncbi:lipase [Gordonia terrae]|uniref:Lipase n=2 Tax=Gordonia terrae TaxID=2055 RepID=A0AAD0K4J1_9ACTN|nr:lipase [Gordonia terrae]